MAGALSVAALPGAAAMLAVPKEQLFSVLKDQGRAEALVEALRQQVALQQVRCAGGHQAASTSCGACVITGSQWHAECNP